VVEEIVAAGGEAVANTGDVSTVDGAGSIAAAAIDAFGRLDVVVNNAGNLEPDDMPSLTPEALGRHLNIHVIGSYNVTRASWPHMVQRGYGRVVMTSSIGMFGGPYLIAYSTAKGGVFSLGRSLAVSGEEHGIKVNLVAPVAETRMVTDPQLRERSNLPPLDDLSRPTPGRGPELVSPMVVLLAHEACPVNGEFFEAGLGRFARVFLGETRGVVDPDLGAEGILARWDEIIAESDYLVHAHTKEALTFREGLIAARTETPSHERQRP
jgi:NAD(P)-dependent dehydrogenase (short-subunit alcohol dehydrogenase family)